jgi:hypothetical protein
MVMAVLASLVMLAGVGLFWRTLSRLRVVSGASPSGLLLGAAVAAVLFRTGVYALVVWPLWYVVGAMKAMGTAAAFTAGSVSGVSTSGTELLHELANAASQVAAAPLDAMDRFVEAFPLVAAINALLVTAAIASIFNRPAVGGSAGESRFQRWWSALDQRRRGLVGVVVVLLAGTYLSIAAVIAIPWLVGDEGAAESTLTKEALAAQLSRLDSLAPRDTSAFVRDTLAVFNAVARVKQAVEASRQSIRGLKHPSLDSAGATVILNEVLGSADQLLVSRQSFATEADRLRGDFRRQLTQPRERAMTAFSTKTSKQMTATERSVYFNDLTNWATDLTTNIARQIDLLATVVREQDVKVADWATNAVRQLNDDVQRVVLLAKDSANSARISLPSPTDWTPRFPSLFDVLGGRIIATVAAPEPPEPGLGWGPFASVSQWLLRTKSIQLAQIAGMLGFGLFGAALSAFRWREKSAASGMEEVAVVVISGFSATLVIFLAVNGGLAVLTEQASKPDSYVLFFACFVGAVYSQDVWAWARGRLGETFGNTPKAEPTDQTSVTNTTNPSPASEATAT